MSEFSETFKKKVNWSTTTKMVAQNFGTVLIDNIYEQTHIQGELWSPLNRYWLGCTFAMWAAMFSVLTIAPHPREAKALFEQRQCYHERLKMNELEFGWGLDATENNAC
jgi:hypothetical protein